MKIEEVKVFEGRNIYSHRKCIKIVMDLEGYSEIPSKDIENFNEGLLTFIPELKKHKCCLNYEGGFQERLKEGTYIAHICEHLIIALQNIIGLEVSYGKAREISGEKYLVVFEYVYKYTGVECASAAVEIINSLINKKALDINKLLNKLKETLMGELPGVSTRALIDEGKKRSIPCTKLGEGSLYQLGYGKASKIIEATITSNTSAISVDIACDKYITREILKKQFIPVPLGGVVKDIDDLLYKAEKIQYPVVIKPRYGNQGKHVYVNIATKEEAVQIYNKLKLETTDIIVEKHIQGKDYRICIVNGTLAAASQRIPPFIIGNGKSTISELIEILNSSEDRGEGHEKPLTRIKTDVRLMEQLSKHSYSLDSVLIEGERFNLMENANLSTGGVAVDCTDKVSKENLELCIRCADAIGLDVCGIDICCKDISKPIKKGGAVIEVNAAPGIRMHHYPDKGNERNVASKIIDMLFDGIEKSIPVISVTGTNGKTTTTRLISHILKLKGLTVGMTTTGGIYIDGKCIEKGDTTGYESALAVLLNKRVDAAVLECARGGIIRNGLAYDLADVGIITNITEDHVGIDGIKNIQDLANVKSLVAEAVKDEGHVVLNGDDKISLTIIDRIKSNLVIFSKDKSNITMRKVIEDGGAGVYCDQGIIYFENQSSCISIARVDMIGISLRGKLTHNIENALAACAACIALKVDVKIIKKGLMSFFGDEDQNPGRFNIYNLNNTTIVLDYGHNIEGYKAVINGAKQFKHKRIVGIIGVPGDRSDNNINEIGKISGESFDYIYIKEDKDRRGRRKGEVAEILKKGVISSGFKIENTSIVLDEKIAFKDALDNSRPGDIIVIFFERREPLLKVLNEKIQIIENSQESSKVV